MALPDVVKFTILLESPIADAHLWQNFVYEAKELVKMLNKFETKVEISLTDNFDQFLKILACNQVDCFVFDWNYKECDLLDLIAKIRKSNNFNNSTIIVLYDKKDEVDPNQYSVLNINMAVTRPIFFENFNSDLKRYLENKFKKLIPEHYSVLMVDDDPDILEIVEDYVQRLGHKNITKAYSVTQANELIRDNDYDLIFLDQNLGDGTCYEIMDYMRTQDKRKRIVDALTIIVTGVQTIESTMSFRMRNIRDQIIKPFDFFEFQEKLTYALDNHKKM
jgi:DNA-binding response OmpR family regulator